MRRFAILAIALSLGMMAQSCEASPHQRMEVSSINDQCQHFDITLIPSTNAYIVSKVDFDGSVIIHESYPEKAVFVGSTVSYKSEKFVRQDLPLDVGWRINYSTLLLANYITIRDQSKKLEFAVKFRCPRDGLSC